MHWSPPRSASTGRSHVPDRLTPADLATLSLLEPEQGECPEGECAESIARPAFGHARPTINAGEMPSESSSAQVSAPPTRSLPHRLEG